MKTLKPYIREIGGRKVYIQSCEREGDGMWGNIGIEGADEKLYFQHVRTSGDTFECLDLPLCRGVTQAEYDAFFGENLSDIVQFAEDLI